MTPERTHRIRTVLSHRQPDLTVLLENVHDPHNISAVLRTCDAVGIQELYILNTKIPLHTTFGTRSSASAAGWLTIHQFDNKEDCFSILRKKYTRIYATHLATESFYLYELNLAGPVALVFGNEHAGVSDEVLALCDGNFVIPQVGMIPSLNISVACAVTLYEAFRQRQVAGMYDGVPRLGDHELRSLAAAWGLEET